MVHGIESEEYHDHQKLEECAAILTAFSISFFSSTLREYSAQVAQVHRQLEPLKHNLHPPDTHHCWVCRGSME